MSLWGYFRVYSGVLGESLWEYSRITLEVLQGHFWGLLRADLEIVVYPRILDSRKYLSLQKIFRMFTPLWHI